MSHFIFSIPMSRDDLFEASSRQQYVVENVYNLRDLKIKLQDCAAVQQQQGADFVLMDGFDVVFSLLGEFNKSATVDMKQTGFELCQKGMISLIDQLSLLLNSGNVLDMDERISALNKMKMLLYLFCQLVDLIEAEQCQADPLTGGKQKAKKKSARDDDFTWDWDQERARAVNLIYNLLQLNLNTLFDPPLMEEEVINLIANTMFRVLENPALALQKTKDVRLSIMQVLGTVNKRFNYTLSCSLKFIQQLKHFEHLVSVLAQAAEVMVREFNCNNMVLELVREISRVDTKELARDSSGTRSYSLFLVELAERLPEFLKPCISLLTTHLDGDSPSMRKCVLGVLGEIVMKVLTKEDMTETDKDDRDNFLDCLEDHVHDVHAHVRSHALQTWSKLCSSKCIPLARQHKILELAVARLQDKSSNVRKAAVQLLNTLLQSNPFAAKLQTEELEQKLAEERDKLQAMEPPVPEEPLTLWTNIQKKVQERLADVARTEESVWENASVKEVCARIARFLEREEVDKAYSLLLSAQEKMPKEAIFQPQQQQQKSARQQEDNSDEDEEEESSGEEEEDEELLKVLKAVFLSAHEEPEVSLSQSQGGPEEELAKQRMLIQYLTDSVKCSRIIDRSLPVVAQLLGSKQPTDILEAIEFFVSAFEFGVQNAMIGVRKMLALIWSRESNIKDAVVAAYKRLYINVEISNARSQSLVISRNLIALVVGATLGEVTSMEKLLAEFVASKDIGKGVFTVLWEYFTGVLPEAHPEDGRAAIALLGMCANSEVSIVTANIQVILDHGLGAKGEADFRLAQYAFNALLKMVPEKLKQDDPEAPTKFQPDHQLLGRIEKLIVDGIFVKTDPHYLPMAKVGLKVLFQLCERPDSFAGGLVRRICDLIRDRAGDSVQKEGDSGSQVETFVLRRLCFLVGEVALNLLNYLDVNVFNELKRRNFLREAKATKEKNAKKKAAAASSKATNKRLSAVRATALETPRSSGKDTTDDDDMGVVGAEADDAEAEFIRKVCEKEVVSGETILSSFTPLLVAICSNLTKYPDPDLRANASLALTKYMLVSSEFCEKHLQLIFTMLEKAAEPVIRANLIIALGDLSFRFPNTVEPWTPKMYARLHDESVKVRSNTLTVLTHLILNDMIKVKGQISDMAFCIVDQVDRISGLSKLFFAELAKKGNTLYNVMPDIVSRLSDPEVGIAEEQFRTIMRYIIGLIEKDKLLESLVEKLCHRFRATRTRRQWRDIAFCLSLFPYSDKSLKKLSENFACWSDKLCEDSVYESIQNIFSGVKKGVGQGPVGSTNRGEIKQLIEELEAKVDEAREKGVEDDTADQRAAAAQKKKAKGSKRRSRKDSSDDDDEEEEPALETGERRQSSRRSVVVRKKQVEESEEEEEEEEEEEREEQPRAKGRAEKVTDKSSRGRNSRVQVEDEEESEDEEEEEEEAPKSARGKGKTNLKKSSAPEVASSKRRDGKRPSSVRGGREESEDDFQEVGKSPRKRGKPKEPTPPPSRSGRNRKR